MEIFTIGSSGTNGRRLVENLGRARATALVDTRIHPNSQLAGFAKQDNLQYLLELTLGIPLIHAEEFCPPEGLLRQYRNKDIDWAQYESEYLSILANREARSSITAQWGLRPVLLCSEPTPTRCHRRLAAEYISGGNIDISITHLLDSDL